MAAAAAVLAGFNAALTRIGFSAEVIDQSTKIKLLLP